MKLTDEQNEIINCKFDNILLINAFAWTWKTTTLVEFCKERKDKKILYLAYNKWLREEAVIKFKGLSNVKVSTVHSLAYRDIWYKYKLRLGNLRPYDIVPFFEWKVNNSIKYYYSFYSLIILRYFLNSEYTLVEFTKKLQTIIKDILAWYKSYNADILIEQFPIIWTSILKSDSFIIEHDFYLKLYQLSSPDLNNYDFILIDESQDINWVMLDLILKQNTKKVFIWDSYQQIYSWRWTKNTFKILWKEKNKDELFLTNSFRCYKYNSNLANQYLKVLWATKDFKWLNRKRTNFDNITILWRKNGSLMNYIIQNKWNIFYVWWFDSYKFNLLLDLDYLLKKDFKAIKDPFLKLFTDINELLYYAEQAEELDIKSMIELAYDINSWKIDIKKLRWVETIEELVVLLKNEETNDYIYCDYCISTTHKAKWLEWDNVKLLSDFKQLKHLEDEEYNKLNLEEINILYVAITRAKQKLIISEDYELTDLEVVEIKNKIEKIKWIKFSDWKKEKIYTQEETKKKHKWAYKRWSQYDDDKLLNLFNNGKNIIQLMDIFERNEWWIIARLEKLWIDINKERVINKKEVILEVDKINISDEIKLLHSKGKWIKEIAKELWKTETYILEYITKIYSLNK